MITLVIEGAGGSELTYQLDRQSISIGASSHNDIVLRDPGVAPRHVVIQRNHDVFTFLGQHRQFVVLNGERRARGVLKVGDRIRIGTATIVFKGSDEGGQDIRLVDQTNGRARAEKSPGPATERRSEIVLYREPHRLSDARSQLVEIFRSRVRSDLIPALRAFFAAVFGERQALIALVDGNGRFQPVVSQWQGDLPRLPSQTFDELASAGRFAEVHLGGRLFLVYPVNRGSDQSSAYLLGESSPEERDDDLDLLGELARLLSIHWQRVEQSTALFTEWAGRCQHALHEALPGTSQASSILRDSVGVAARSSSPVMLCGVRGSGRMFLANLIATLRPAGPAPVRVFEARSGNESVSVELFGLGPDETTSSPAERLRGSAVVIRDVHAMSPKLQRELAAKVAGDLEAAYGPSVRWSATTGPDTAAMLNEGVLDATLYRLFEHHVIRVPSLADRREDLPLLIVRLLERVGAEQEKEINGIELATLNSLLDHPFDGQMTELLAELRRLVSATPDGEMVRGLVPRAAARGLVDSPADAAGPDVVASLLEVDDLKVVIPEVERMIIDRVLRRTRGNQSQAARTLNLSRGALISKIKEYEIPDYRALRKKG